MNIKAQAALDAAYTDLLTDTLRLLSPEQVKKHQEKFRNYQRALNEEDASEIPPKETKEELPDVLIVMTRSEVENGGIEVFSTNMKFSYKVIEIDDVGETDQTYYYDNQDSEHVPDLTDILEEHGILE